MAGLVLHNTVNAQGFGNARSGSLTVTSDPNGIIIATVFSSTGDNLTSIKYAGADLTVVDKQTFSNGCVYLCYLLNPTVGTNNLTITSSDANPYMAIFASGWSNARQTDQATPTTKQTTTSNTVSSTLTPTTGTARHFMAVLNAATTYVAGTGTVKIVGDNAGLYASSADIAAGVANTITINKGASEAHGYVSAIFYPEKEPGGGQILTFI